MSKRKKPVPTTTRDIIKHPEFLKAYRIYLEKGKQYHTEAIDATIEIFQTMDQDKLGISLDTFDKILQFDEQVINDLYNDFVSKYVDPDITRSQDSINEYKRFIDIIKKHKGKSIW